VDLFFPHPKKEKLAALKVEQLKPKAKRLGVKLTNPSGNAKTKAQLINAIVKAEEKKPVAKKTAAKRRVVKKGLAPVSGASKRRDAERQALPPGRRTSKTGRVYYERRANRADAKQSASKGQMLGAVRNSREQKINYNKWTPSTLVYEIDFDVANYEIQRTSIDQYFIDKMNKGYVEIVSPFVYEFEGMLYSTCLSCIAKAKIKYIRNERSAYMDYTSYAIDQLKKNT